MGTWGHQFNENDDAADFLEEVADSQDWNLIAARIDSYVANGGYEDAQPTVAALEMVATALGKPPAAGIDTPTAIWATSNLPHAEILRANALAAVDLIAEKSELSELWAESEVNPDDAANWRGTLANLKSRLIEA